METTGGSGRRRATRRQRADDTRRAAPAATVRSGATDGKRADAAAGKAVATPWGPARLLDELALPQDAGGREFASLVQLLESADGERLVRFAYATGGTARRGPVTLRRGDLDRLHAELAQHPQLKEALDP